MPVRQCTDCGGESFEITISRAVKCADCGNMVGVIDDPDGTAKPE